MAVLKLFSVVTLSGFALAAYARDGNSTATKGTTCACQQLEARYGNSVLYPTSSNYTEEVTNYWDVRSDLSPTCIFLPSDASGVVDAVSVFSQCSTEFAVRGGGHMNVCWTP